MYERFTDRARKVMQLANQDAQRFNHEYIGTEHVLLGLVKEGSGVAANVLKNLDVDLRKVRREVEAIVQFGASDDYPIDRLPHTPRTKKVIEYSIEEARNLNHNYVGTEHLLLGLLREQEGVAAQVLMNLGLKLEDVREEVLNLLGHNSAMVAGVAPTLVVDLTPGVAPLPLTDGQLRLVHRRIRRLTGRAESHAASAAKCRDEADALTRLLAWYEQARKE
jgi:ATP-dependent Clp protease ATP-binding subunit ClpA